jgi:sugar phosphate isomerase/epimerase
MTLRLGISGILPSSMYEVSAAHARRIRELGFACVAVHFLADDPAEVPIDECRRVSRVLADEGIAITQSTGYAHYTLPLIHRDAAVREQALRTLRAGLRVGAALGAGNVLTGAGSLNPAGAYYPHPENFTQRSRDLLVDTLRAAARTAADLDVPISIEGHLLTTVDSPERMVEVLDAVDSPFVQATCDPVNYIGSLAAYYDTAGVLRRFIVPLAGRIACAHAKDIVLEDRLTLHLDEGAPGEGGMDYVTFLQLLDRHAPGADVIVEHVPVERAVRGASFLVETAARAGVQLLTTPPSAAQPGAWQ